MKETPIPCAGCEVFRAQKQVIESQKRLIENQEQIIRKLLLEQQNFANALKLN